MRVLIVGGSLGGCATAIALAHVGIEAAIYERVPDLSRIQVGAGVFLWPNGIHALDRLGAGEAVRAAGMAIERFEIQGRRGRSLARWPVGALSRARGAPTVTIARPELQRILAARVEPGTLRLGATFTAYEQDEAGVTIRLADGSTARGDALVGADGIGSVVRAQLLGRKQPVFAGYTAWRGIAQIRQTALPTGVVRIVWGRGIRIVLYHVGPDRVSWLAFARAKEGGRDAEGEHRAAALATFRGLPDPVEAVLQATDEAAIVRIDIYDRDPVERWSDGRVTLIGDAAHVMTPNHAQGACLTFEDAVVLARRLAENLPVPDALPAYERDRTARTALITRRSRSAGKIGHVENPLACALRDWGVKLVINRLILREIVEEMSFVV